MSYDESEERREASSVGRRASDNDHETRIRKLELELVRVETTIQQSQKHIDLTISSLRSDIKELKDLISDNNRIISNLNVSGAVTRQSTTVNDKMIWALVSFVISGAMFAVGKML